MVMKTSQEDSKTDSVELHITLTVPNSQQVEEQEDLLYQL